MTAATPDAPWTVDPDSRLDATDDVPQDHPVLRPLVAYARGHATGDTSHFRSAFRAGAHVEGIRESGFVSWSLEDYCGNFGGSPAPDEASRRRTITLLRRAGTIALAEMVLEHGADRFTDQFVLIEQDGDWRIANKVYDRAPAS